MTCCVGWVEVALGSLLKIALAVEGAPVSVVDRLVMTGVGGPLGRVFLGGVVFLGVP